MNKGGDIMYKALDIAKYVVAKCYNDWKPITNLKLQKILFYIQRSYLISDSRAFSDDIQAWMYGPVVSAVYYHYCSCGAMPIFSIEENAIENIEKEDRKKIDPIVEKYREYEVWRLVDMTHNKGGAWDKTYSVKGGYSIIPIDDIKECPVGE